MTENNEAQQSEEKISSPLEGFFAEVERDFAEEHSEQQASDSEESEPKEEGEDSTENEEEAPDPLVEWQSKYETLEKRFKDTQQWGNERNKQLASLIEKAKENEWMSEEDLSTLDTSVPENEHQLLARRLSEELPKAIAMAAEITGKSQDDMQRSVEAFTALVDYDADILAELQSLPEPQQAAYVLKKGAELEDVYGEALESGSLLKLAINSMKGSDSKVSKAVKEAEERVRLELEEKYKEYISPTNKSRPKLHGSGTQAKAKPEKLEDALKGTFNSLFNK